MATDEYHGEKTENYDVEGLLEKKKHIEELLKHKFTKQITVMFTDLKGSTSITEAEGDLALRVLIKDQSDIIMPAIKECNGKFVKSIGDGTLSYFDSPQEALRAAVGIQRKAKEFNAYGKPKIPIQLRIGLHTGECIVEKDDIFGDVVNVACRFESQAEAGEICISEETFNNLQDKDEFCCRYFKTSQLKGKKEAFKIYKVTEVPILYKLVYLMDNGEMVEYPITGHGLTIGRGPRCDLRLAEDIVSVNHFHIWQENTSLYVKDTGSTNGTFLEGRKLKPDRPAKVSAGQTITINNIRFAIISAEQAANIKCFGKNKPGIFKKLGNLWK